MAKKSAKSSKRTLFDLITIILSGSVFGWLALPYVKFDASVLGSSTTSGYKLLDFDANEAIATVLLIPVIVAGLLALASISKTLVDVGVVNSKSASKMLGLVMMVLALVMVGISVATMIVVPKQCTSHNFGSLGNVGSSAQWLGMIATLLVSLLSLATSYLAAKK